MDEDLLEHVLTLLGGAGVEVGVSYFAGGILANLMSTGVSGWTLDLELRDAILSKLVFICVCSRLGLCVFVLSSLQCTVQSKHCSTDGQRQLFFFLYSILPS